MAGNRRKSQSDVEKQSQYSEEERTGQILKRHDQDNEAPQTAEPPANATDEDELDPDE